MVGYAFARYAEYMVAIGQALYSLVCAFVALRLFVLARRQRTVTEVYLAAGLVLQGFFGLVFMQLASASWVAESSRDLALGTSLLALYFGIAGQALFARDAYGRGKPVEERVFLVLAALMTVAAAVDLVLGVHRDYGPDVMPRAWLLGGFALRGLAVVILAERNWAVFRALRKQLRLGLTDGEVVTRVFLYSIALSSNALIYGSSFVGRVVTGAGMRQNPALLAGASALGVVAALSVWLAFAPPKWFLALQGSRRG